MEFIKLITKLRQRVERTYEGTTFDSSMIYSIRIERMHRL